MFKKRGETSTFFGKYKLWVASFTLIGTVIGAGILALPYVVAKSGFLYGLLWMVLIGAGMLVVNLCVGEVILRTRKQHQLTGYAEKYLGEWGKRVMAFVMLFGIYGALIAYLIGEGESLHTLLGFGSPLVYSLIFFGIAFLIVNRGMKATGGAEFILVTFMLLFIFSAGLLSITEIKGSYLLSYDARYFFFPFGAVLFAYLGAAAIPEMQEELGKDRRLFKRAILIGSLLPIIIYILFTLIVVGTIGLDNFEALEPNQRIATIALSLHSLPLLGVLANIVAIFTMFTSFLTLSMALLEMYHYDYGLSRSWALALTCIIPLLVVLLGLTTFITIISITGAIVGGVQGVLFMLMYWKAKRLGDRIPEYSLPPLKVIGVLIIILFSIGVFYELWSNIF